MRNTKSATFGGKGYFAAGGTFAIYLIYESLEILRFGYKTSDYLEENIYEMFS